MRIEESSPKMSHESSSYQFDAAITGAGKSPRIFFLLNMRCHMLHDGEGHRPREIGIKSCWGELEKITHFKRLKNFCRGSQNDLAFLGRIRKPSLSEFPEIYVTCDECPFVSNTVHAA